VKITGKADDRGEADVYIGGGAADHLKREIKCALDAMGLSIKVKIATQPMIRSSRGLALTTS
jgi:hypothetical protein